MSNKSLSNNSNNINKLNNYNNNQLQQHQQPNMIIKFPGLARPSSAIERYYRSSSNEFNVNKEKKSNQNNHHNHNNNNNNGNHDTSTHFHNSNSFEQFNASCDDAWNDKIDDKISYGNLMKNSSCNNNNGGSQPNHMNGKHKFGYNKSSILIKEIPSSDSVNNVNVENDDKLENDANGNDEENKIHNENPKLAKLKKLLHEDENVNINSLRTITWSGIPEEFRPIAWKILIGYLPTLRSKRAIVSENKRNEYQNLVAQYYHNRQDNDEMYRQIHIDIPRMQPLITIFQQPIVQGIFERILYIWSIRHPASGYVQGMNDLVTPFFVTYLSEFVPGHSFNDVESFDVSTLSEETLSIIEADSYWSFTKLLDSIQDNYTFAQPGIQRLVNSLSRVVSRVDKKLHEHLENNSVQYIQFAFRWMNNLLIREIPLRCIIRLWDTYLSEGAISSSPSSSSTAYNGSNERIDSTLSPSSSLSINYGGGSGTPFSSAFHLFVCAAFLRFWSKSLLQESDFQGLMLKLQNLPTFHWSETEVKLLVADAYQLKCTFSPNHLKL